MLFYTSPPAIQHYARLHTVPPHHQTSCLTEENQETHTKAWRSKPQCKSPSRSPRNTHLSAAAAAPGVPSTALPMRCSPDALLSRLPRRQKIPKDRFKCLKRASSSASPGLLPRSNGNVSEAREFDELAISSLFFFRGSALPFYL